MQPDWKRPGGLQRSYNVSLGFRVSCASAQLHHIPQSCSPRLRHPETRHDAQPFANACVRQSTMSGRGAPEPLMKAEPQSIKSCLIRRDYLAGNYHPEGSQTYTSCTKLGRKSKPLSHPLRSTRHVSLPFFGFGPYLSSGSPTRTFIRYPARSCTLDLRVAQRLCIGARPRTAQLLPFGHFAKFGSDVGRRVSLFDQGPNTLCVSSASSSNAPFGWLHHNRSVRNSRPGQHKPSCVDDLLTIIT